MRCFHHSSKVSPKKRRTLPICIWGKMTLINVKEKKEQTAKARTRRQQLAQQVRKRRFSAGAHAWAAPSLKQMKEMCRTALRIWKASLRNWSDSKRKRRRMHETSKPSVDGRTAILKGSLEKSTALIISESTNNSEPDIAATSVDISLSKMPNMRQLIFR